MYRESVWVQVVALQADSRVLGEPVVEIELPQTPFGSMRCQTIAQDRTKWSNLVGQMTLAHLTLVQIEVKLTYQLPQMHILTIQAKGGPDQARIVGQLDGMSPPEEPLEWMVRTLFPFLVTQITGPIPKCEVGDMLEVQGVLSCSLDT